MPTVPLFPLNVVLFPGIPLGLHIFEPRYLEMARWCREHDSPFGVALIRQGEEALGPLAEPYRTGCLARITQVETLPGGRLNLLVEGTQRFRILSLDDHLPYLTGAVEEFPLVITDPADIHARANVFLPDIGAYMNHLTSEQPGEFSAFAYTPPVEAEARLYQAAAILQIPAIERQALLEMEQAAALADELRRIYTRELVLLKNVKLDGEPPDTLPPWLNQN